MGDEAGKTARDLLLYKRFGSDQEGKFFREERGEGGGHRGCRGDLRRDKEEEGSNSEEEKGMKEKEIEREEEKGLKNKEGENTLEIKFININGLNLVKFEEIKNQFNNKDIFIMVETHWRSNRFDIEDSLEVLEKRRERESKKGGGIMLLYRKNSGLKGEVIDSLNEDLLVTKMEHKGLKFIIIICYWDVKDKEKNISLIQEINQILKIYNTQRVLIVGT